LHGKEGVISSTPNFWREMVSKWVFKLKKITIYL